MLTFSDVQFMFESSKKLKYLLEQGKIYLSQRERKEIFERKTVREK